MSENRVVCMCVSGCVSRDFSIVVHYYRFFYSSLLYLESVYLGIHLANVSYAPTKLKETIIQLIIEDTENISQLIQLFLFQNDKNVNFLQPIRKNMEIRARAVSVKFCLQIRK